MAARRYYYSDSIMDFLSRSNNEIVGALTLASQHDVNDEMLKFVGGEQDAGTGSCTELGCGTSHAAEPNAYNSTEIENVIRIYGRKEY